MLVTLARSPTNNPQLAALHTKDVYNSFPDGAAGLRPWTV